MSFPACPVCGTMDYDTNEAGTEGFCIVSCGAWFVIKDGKAEKVGDCSPVILPPGTEIER